MPSRHAGLLQEIISYRFQPEQIEAAIADFEYKITKYETQSGEKIGEKLKIAIIQKGLHDGQMQGHLVLHAARLNTWDGVRNEVQAVLQTRIAIAACQSVPMEIGFVAKGKAKKGKDKGNGKDTKGKFGKDKGKASPPTGKGKGSKPGSKDLKDVECFYCKKKGHLRRDCRKYFADHGKSVNEVDQEETLNMAAVEATGSEWVWSLETKS